MTDLLVLVTNQVTDPVTSQQLVCCICFPVGKILEFTSIIYYALARRFPWPLSCPVDGFLQIGLILLSDSFNKLLMMKEVCIKAASKEHQPGYESACGCQGIYF